MALPINSIVACNDESETGRENVSFLPEKKIHPFLKINIYLATDGKPPLVLRCNHRGSCIRDYVQLRCISYLRHTKMNRMDLSIDFECMIYWLGNHRRAYIRIHNSLVHGMAALSMNCSLMNVIAIHLEISKEEEKDWHTKKNIEISKNNIHLFILSWTSNRSNWNVRS